MSRKGGLTFFFYMAYFYIVINSKNIYFDKWPPSLYSFLTSTKLTTLEIEDFQKNLFTPIKNLEKEKKYDISKLL